MSYMGRAAWANDFDFDLFHIGRMERMYYVLGNHHAPL
jgi:hypothetical protein